MSETPERTSPEAAQPGENSQRVSEVRRKAMRYIAYVVMGGAAGGIVLIFLAGMAHGFWSRLADGVGAGLVVAAIVAAITPKVVGRYNFAFPSRSDTVLNELDLTLDLLSDFLINWKATQLADEDERQKTHERFEARVRQFADEVGQPRRGESDETRQIRERLQVSASRIVKALDRERMRKARPD